MLKTQKLNKLNTFYHPTTVVAVDDEGYFLDNLKIRFSQHISYAPFKHSLAALSFVNSASNDADFSPKSKNYGVLDIIQNRHRFQAPTVVVVDYAMPDINGLEFCRQLSNPHIKKIMLTGVANHKLGKQAISDGVIDNFVRKDDQHCWEKVNDYIYDAQYQYCLEQSQITSSVNAFSYPFMRDQSFIFYFFELISKYDIAEYYLENNQTEITEYSPCSFLLIDLMGKTYRFSIFTEKNIDHLIQYCTNQHAPLDIIELLASKKKLLHVIKPDGNVCQSVVDWYNLLADPIVIRARNTYYCTLSEISPSTMASNIDIFSYDDHLVNHDKLMIRKKDI